MKTARKFLAGTSLFVLGILFTLGVAANSRHHDFDHHAGVRKAAIIEVGAPLTVPQLKTLGLF